MWERGHEVVFLFLGDGAAKDEVEDVDVGEFGDVQETRICDGAATEEIQVSDVGELRNVFNVGDLCAVGNDERSNVG